MRIDRPSGRPEDPGEGDSPSPSQQGRPRTSELRDDNGLTPAEYIAAWNQKVESREAEKEDTAAERPRRDPVMRDANGMTAAELRFQHNRRVEQAEAAKAKAAEKVEPVSEVDDQPDNQRRFKTLTEEFGESRTFRTFDAARNASIREHGARPRQELHHLVERCQQRPQRSGFSAEQIHSSDNLTWIDKEVHTPVSARFSRKPFGESVPLRDLMNGESWEEQYETGCDVLNEEMEKYRDRNDG